jgi:hypothetical protein
MPYAPSGRNKKRRTTTTRYKILARNLERKKIGRFANRLDDNGS